MWEIKLKLIAVCTYIILLFGAILWHLVNTIDTVEFEVILSIISDLFQIGTDSGYFPPTLQNSACHYILDSSYSYSKITEDHTHL